MKANRTSIPRTPDDEGVSTVIGAIIITGILVTSLVTVRVQFVPVWEENKEAARMAEVSTQLATLKADLDRMADNRSSVPVANPITLRETTSSAFAGQGIGDAFRLQSTNALVNTSASKLHFITSNQSAVSSLNDDWQSIEGTTSVENVSRVDSLRLRIEEVSKSKAESKAALAPNVEITVRDPDNNVAGRLVFELQENPPDYQSVTTTYNDADQVVFQENIAYFQQGVYSPYYINALKPQTLFDQVLAGAKKPVSLTLTHTVGFPADFSISYLEHTPEGPVQVGGTGPVVEPFAEGFPGGSLVLEARNQYFVSQTYTVEHGAVILEQPDGAIFKVKPQFTAVRGSAATALTITLPSITGPRTDLTGASSAIMYATPIDTRSYTALGPDYTLRIQTEYPELWASLWRNELEEAGLSSTGVQPQFRILTTSGSAELTVYGTASDPADVDRLDLSIIFRQAVIKFRVEP